MEIGPQRDIIGDLNLDNKYAFLYLNKRKPFSGDLANSIRKKTNITFGLYHSLFEWFNPLFLSDEKSGFSKQDFVRVNDIFFIKRIYLFKISNLNFYKD